MLSNSTPPTSSYAPNSKSFNTSKRASFQGPRPLHLLDGTTSSPTSPVPQSPISPRTTNIRRQSSISYNTPSPLTRSASLGAKSHRHSFPGVSPASSSGTRTPIGQAAKEAGKGNGTAPAAQVLTLAEKHRDLLHFIAQKESKCLELRTQLEAHEKELAELKKKWERIVSRGFRKAQSLSASPNPGSLDSNNPAAVLDGIKGFFGLSSSAPAPEDQPTPRSNTFSISSNPKPNAHTPSSSTSTSPSTSRSSARYSQSSQSSIGDVPEEAESSESITKAEKRAKRLDDIHIVTDTGATPLVSPNSEFAAYFGDSSGFRRRTSPESSRKSPKEEFGDFQSGGTGDVADWDRRKPINSKRVSLPLITPNDVSNVSSWVGSVGKTISKHPTAKRASVFLGDVVQALTSPPPVTASTPSLLDEDVPSLDTTTLTPSPSSPAPLKPTTIPSSSSSLTLKPSITRKERKNAKKEEEDEDEWNW
ncbi:hypothetical protein WG66_006855 [Moniliophthora roreri]|nr:hypothetical protein WG66_006855 [Moniliophthora roreri]